MDLTWSRRGKNLSQLRKTDEMQRGIKNCEACGKRRWTDANGRINLNSHHLSDEAYGNETEENMAVLCTQCHMVANLLKRYFGFIEKKKLLEIVCKMFEDKPVRNIRKRAEPFLSEQIIRNSRSKLTRTRGSKPSQSNNNQKLLSQLSSLLMKFEGE